VFETNAEALPPSRFVEFAQPYLLQLAENVRHRTAPIDEGGPALSIFAKGASHALATFANPTISKYDVISLDWNTDPVNAVNIVRNEASKALSNHPKTLQGNLDPCELFGSQESIILATKKMLQGFSGHPHIANLGHGMLPSHTPEALRCFFDTVNDARNDL
jgi:uroporphyrinogen decarboxylase